MSLAKCLICKAEFYIKPSNAKRGWGKYCSIQCRSKSQFNGKDVRCFICSKQVYRSLKDLKSSDSGNYFCGRSCQTIWRNTVLFPGENHSNWKYGESAYKRILGASDKEKACMLCETKDIRILAVHHIDKNRKNNNITNLIWLCHNCHYLIHHYSNEQSKLKKKINMVVVVQK